MAAIPLSYVDTAACWEAGLGLTCSPHVPWSSADIRHMVVGVGLGAGSGSQPAWSGIRAHEPETKRGKRPFPCVQALWTRDGTSILYPCHAVIVLLHIRSHEQRFFLGHTDEVGFGPEGQCCCRPGASSACPSAGLCPGPGWKEPAPGFGSGATLQHATSLGLVQWPVPVPTALPSPHHLLTQVGLQHCGVGGSLGLH